MSQRAQELRQQICNLAKPEKDLSTKEKPLLLEFNNCLQQLERYFDSVLDLFEKKFIVYEYNILNQHWQSLVSVNAGLVTHPPTAMEAEVRGFFVLDSLAVVAQNKNQQLPERCDYMGETGFLFFLNCAWNYHNMRGESGNNAFQWDYNHEPFGQVMEYCEICDQPSCHFPQLLIGAGGIVMQHNSNDCGFGSVANSMTIVWCFKAKKFKMTDVINQGDRDADRLVLDKTYNLNSFWSSVIIPQGTTDLTTIFPCTASCFILNTLRKENIVLIDRLVKLFCVDESQHAAVIQKCSPYPYCIPMRPGYAGFQDFLDLYSQRAAKKPAEHNPGKKWMQELIEVDATADDTISPTNKAAKASGGKDDGGDGQKNKEQSREGRKENSGKKDGESVTSDKNDQEEEEGSPHDLPTGFASYHSDSNSKRKEEGRNKGDPPLAPAVARRAAVKIMKMRMMGIKNVKQLVTLATKTPKKT
jgi:hypothetical protein